MTPTRRDFLHGAGATLGATALALGQTPSKPAAAPNVPTLVVVYLRGGADMLGSIVPYADPNYPKVHPTLAVPGPDSKGENAALRLDDTFAFNPNLKPLHALYEKGLCAPIVCVGSPHPTRSHFDAQDFMDRGAPGQKLITTGWLNRYLSATRTVKDANLRAFSLQPLLPRSMRGPYPVLARPDQKGELALKMYHLLYPPQRGKGAGGQPPPRPGTVGGDAKLAIEKLGARTIEQLFELNTVLEKSPAPAARYPESGFGRQMRDVAKLVKARRGLEVTAIDYNGWDHHIDEGPTNGQLGRKLADVARSIGAFMDDLGQLRQNVLVLVMSEFGRTVQENANRGTDHGHGGFMLAVGGPVKSRKVYGKWTGLARESLYEGRDLPAHTDFRVVFAETLKGLFGFDGFERGLFPDYKPGGDPLGFLEKT